MRPPSFRHRLRLSWTLVLLAWFTQLWLPVAHAAMAAPSQGTMAAWCGDPANAAEARAVLPAEIRQALALDAIDVDHLASCAQLCAVGSTPAPLPAPAAGGSQPAVSHPMLAPARQAPVSSRQHALPPPSQGPPTRA